MKNTLKDKPVPQDGKVDPKRLDASAKPKRRRRKRNRPDPNPELREWEKAAEKRAYARPYPPGVMLEPAGFDQEHWTAPHNDDELWALQLADAFGTRSVPVIATFMRQFEALCGQSHWDEKAHQWRLDENEFSAALAIVNSVKPRNELEACHAAQMVAVHLMTMKVGVLQWMNAEAEAQAANFECPTPQITDGDTLRCGNRRVRLAGIDAPELPGHCRPGRKCAPGDPYASTESLRQIVGNGPLTCRQTDIDAYGRTVARCSVGDIDLSCAQLKGGQAIRRYGIIWC